MLKQIIEFLKPNRQGLTCPCGVDYQCAKHRTSCHCGHELTVNVCRCGRMSLA